MKHRMGFPLLLAAGLLLLFTGMIGLWNSPALLQYAFVPRENGGANPPSMAEKLETARESMGEAFPLLTLHGEKTGVTLTAGNTSLNDVCLYMTGASWHEVYPRRMICGRPLSGIDARQKAKVIVLDEKTAFSFFGEADPLGKTVKIDEIQFEVVGVAAHSRRVGEPGALAAWIPLDVMPACDLMVLSAPAQGNSGLWTVFLTGAAEVFGAGTMICLPREKLAAGMMPRLTLILLAIWLLKRWLKVLSAFWRERVNRIRERNSHSYLGRVLPYALVQTLPAVLLTGLTIAAGYGIAVLAAEPIRFFPNWVPESLGDFSAWVSRFWDLTAEAARPVSLQTPELAEIRFRTGFVRWGLLLALLGTVRLCVGKKTRDGSREQRPDHR